MAYGRILNTGILLTALIVGSSAATVAGEVEDDLRRHVEMLASDEFEGRFTGSLGAQKAAEYLVEQLTELGAEPLSGEDDFLLEFEFTAGSNDGGSTLDLRGGEEETSWDSRDALQALSFSDNGEVAGSVVFAGYGLKVPESDGFAYDSFATLDVEDKIVLVLRYFPEDAEQDTRTKLARYSGLRYKAMQARERGAKAMLVVAGPRSPNAGEIVPMKFDTAVAGSGLVAASISGDVAEEILKFADKGTLETVQESFDDANPHVTGFEIPGVELTLDIKVERERKTGRNVVAVLPATVEEPREEPYLLLGAHYDHLGRGRGSNSLARKDEADGIHYGADDNASGVAAVLEVAEAMQAMSRPRNVVVALWSGEELGLLGANKFIESGVFPVDQAAAYINFDQVGRMREERLSLQAVGSSPVWRRFIEQANVPVGLDIELQDDPYLPTDSAAFNGASVPTLNFFTGGHEDYHRPSDTAEKINYEDLARVVRLATLIANKVGQLEEPPEFVKVERKVQEGGGRDAVRAYTGTIPDYTTEVAGLLLSGVVEGGPAEEAGLEEGDVIVEFAGQTIANIYDYTYALDAVKVDQPVKVIYERDGARHETTITPRARD